MTFLTKSLDEHSVTWILISLGLGGVIGALLKFAFDSVFATAYRSRRESCRRISEYKYPLLKAADTLDKRIQNFVEFVDRGWYESSDYYRISTLYAFGNFLAWCKLIEEEAYVDLGVRKFYRRFYGVFKSLTGFFCFDDVSEGMRGKVPDATVPRFALTAIGELMLERESENPGVMRFVDFAEAMSTDHRFGKWFGYLEDNLLKGQRCDSTSARWNRILVFGTILRTFVAFLDPKSRRTSLRQIRYLSAMHEVVARNVYKEIQDTGTESLVAEDGPWKELAN